MKKIFALMLVLVLMLSLAACGEKFECDECGEEKTGKKYEDEIFGEEFVLCEECHEELQEGLEELEDALGELEDALS